MIVDSRDLFRLDYSKALRLSEIRTDLTAGGSEGSLTPSLVRTRRSVEFTGVGRYYALARYEVDTGE